MKAYVINLARSPERRAHMVSQLARAVTSYRFVEAVDGRELDLPDPSVLDPALFTRTSGPGFRPGSAGCALSHLRVFRQIIQDGTEHGLVLEDDVVLPSDLEALADAVAAQMSGPEVALLNFHAPEPCEVTDLGSVPLPGSRSLVYPVRAPRLTSAGAYVVTREACLRLEEFLLPLRTYVDDWGHFCGEGILDAVRCVVPMPVTNSPTFRSTIDYYSPGSFQWRLRESLDQARLPLVSRALILRRRRTFRRLGWTGEVKFVETTAPGRARS